MSNRHSPSWVDQASVEQTVAIFQAALPQCGPDPIEYVAKHGESVVRGIKFVDRLRPAILDALAKALPETARKVMLNRHGIDARTGIPWED